MASAENPKNEQGKPSEERKPAAENASNSPPVVRTIVEIPDSVIQEYRRKNQEQARENSKNRTIAKWAVVGAWIYACIAAWQLCAMQTNNTQALIAFQTENRPWIALIADISSPLVFNANGGEVTLGFNLKNTGHAAATNITINALMDDWNLNGDTKQKQLCDPLRSAMNTSGFAIVPGGELPNDVAVGMDANKVKADWDLFPNAPHSVETNIFGCIDYRMAGLAKHYQTWFNFDLDEKGRPDKPSTKWAFSVKVPLSVVNPTSYPAKDLELYKSPYGGWYAD